MKQSTWQSKAVRPTRHAGFVDADGPSAGHHIRRAADDGLSVVVVSGDDNIRVLKPELGDRKDLRPIET